MISNSHCLSDFEEYKWTFIGKTDLIYNLISNGASYILTRLRRSVKSLCFTLLKACLLKISQSFICYYLILKFSLRILLIINELICQNWQDTNVLNYI